MLGFRAGTNADIYRIVTSRIDAVHHVFHLADSYPGRCGRMGSVAQAEDDRNVARSRSLSGQGRGECHLRGFAHRPIG